MNFTGRGVCRQNIWNHVAAFVIPFSLICKMTMFCFKKLNFDLLIPRVGMGGGSASKIFAAKLLHS